LCGELGDDQVCPAHRRWSVSPVPVERKATAIIDYNEAGTNLAINELRPLRGAPAAAGALAARPAAAATDDELQDLSF
jgi:hypothetical protein